MTVSYKTYEECEQAALAVLEADVEKWDATSYTNHYTYITKTSENVFVFNKNIGGCHGWLTSVIRPGVVAVFTSLKERAAKREDAVAYWGWMVNPRLSPWRNFLAKHQHKLVAGKKNRLFAFGFYGEDISEIPLQPIANIFVATRTPLEKPDYFRLYNALSGTSFSETEKRYLCSIGQLSDNGMVRPVDGFHFPFNPRMSVNYWKFSTGNIGVRKVGFSPVNNFWYTANVQLTKHTSYDTECEKLFSTLFTEPKREVKSRFKKAVETSLPNDPFSISSESFITNVLANRDAVFDTAPVKLSGELYESPKKKA